MKYFFIPLLLAAAATACAQTKNENIDVAEVRRIETTLAHDSMQGRKAGTAGSAKAARFIAEEFRKAGLQPLQGNSFLQEFALVQPHLVSASGRIDGKEINPENIIAVTQQPELAVDEKSGYVLEHIKSTDNVGNKIGEIMGKDANAIVFVDPSFARIFPRLSGLRQPFFRPKEGAPAASNKIFILGSQQPASFSFSIKQNLEEKVFANVVGILPGKSKTEEQVIFSGHYDHLGIGRPVNGDSIFNGANDDASGTTAVIMLANYFKKRGGNERTLVFAAFTAEESGGFGSQYFSQQIEPAKVAAMFNMEMIGTESKWGRNSAYITGFEKTNMGTLLQKNLEGTEFTFHPDPYPEQQLFYRSDNATLARLGVPAHTISTSKMDSEKHYHTVEDEVETLDLQNMAAIIRAIAQSSHSIVAGTDTPSRVKAEDLR